MKHGTAKSQRKRRRASHKTFCNAMNDGAGRRWIGRLELACPFGPWPGPIGATSRREIEARKDDAAVVQHAAPGAVGVLHSGCPRPNRGHNAAPMAGEGSRCWPRRTGGKQRSQHEGDDAGASNTITTTTCGQVERWRSMGDGLTCSSIKRNRVVFA
jgi:hypothetical protein